MQTRVGGLALSEFRLEQGTGEWTFIWPLSTAAKDTLTYAGFRKESVEKPQMAMEDFRKDQTNSGRISGEVQQEEFE